MQAMSRASLPDYLPAWMEEHVKLYLEDGEAGHLWDASAGGGKGVFSTLLLCTRGRRSGRTLIIPLIYRPTDDGGYCVIASKGGAPAHPAWFLNVQASEFVELKVAAREFRASAKLVEGQERETLWNLMQDYFPPYKDYQARCEREIPVVVFYPVDEAS